MKGSLLAGKVAIVTGAAQGIGLATAKAFADEGAAVGLFDLNREKIEAAAAGIIGKNGKALAQVCDVRDEASVEGAIISVADHFGSVNIGFCNAATLTPSKSIAEMLLTDWEEALAVNLTGVFLTTKYLIPQMVASGGGSIIITASQMARVATPLRGPYCSTKGALLQLAKVIALENADANIRANTLSPGGVATDRLVQQFGDLETAERVWGPTHPLGRLGQPDEIARSAVFLASDQSSFMTGSDLLVDGGYSAQ